MDRCASCLAVLGRMDVRVVVAGVEVCGTCHEFDRDLTPLDRRVLRTLRIAAPPAREEAA